MYKDVLSLFGWSQHAHINPHCFCWSPFFRMTGEHSISGGFGHYYGGFGAAYTYSPVVGLGIQAGYGTLGAGLGVRWEPASSQVAMHSLDWHVSAAVITQTWSWVQ